MQINEYLNQLEEIYSGNPWYGNSVTEILKSIAPEDAVKKPVNGKHTIADLLYHMITWRVFVIKQLQGDKEFDVKQNDKNDWRELDYTNKRLWNEAISESDKTHKLLLSELNNFKEDLLDKQVPLRNYSYQFLLTGLIQHDIYHLGQITLTRSLL